MSTGDMFYQAANQGHMKVSDMESDNSINWRQNGTSFDSSRYLRQLDVKII